MPEHRPASLRLFGSTDLLPAAMVLCAALAVLGGLTHYALLAGEAYADRALRFLPWLLVLVHLGGCSYLICMTVRLRRAQRERDAGMEELRLSEERFRLIARATSDALGEWDLRTDRVWWSEGFVNLFGEHDEPMQDDLATWAQRVHPDDRARVLEGLRAAVRRGGMWSDRYRFLRADGSYAHVVARGYLMCDRDGHPVRMVGGISDVTAQHNAAGMVEEANRQLRALSAHVLRAQEDERARIARELHDELGQMLTVIKMRLRTALGGLDRSESAEAVEDAIGYAESAVEAVRRLSLDLHPPQLMQFGLAAAVNALLQQQVPEDGPSFVVNSEVDDIELVRTLRIAAFRVVQESVTNALRHADASNIEVDLHCADETLRVVVRDDGKGFDVATAQRKAMEGRSIGLLGMRERCQHLGGQLIISSAPGAGCCVEARLPLQVAVPAYEREACAF